MESHALSVTEVKNGIVMVSFQSILKVEMGPFSLKIGTDADGYQNKSQDPDCKQKMGNSSKKKSLLE